MSVLRAVDDDEPLARSLLRSMLSAHRDVAVVAEAASGADAVGAIEALTPAESERPSLVCHPFPHHSPLTTQAIAP